VRSLELRRHAKRDKNEDKLSPEGRADAERVGGSLSAAYAVVFVSPARRAAETAELFVGSGTSFVVIPGLSSEVEDRWRAAGKAAGSSRIPAIQEQDADLVRTETERLAGVLRGLLARVPEGGRGLAVGHSPLIEAGVYGLTGEAIDPLEECEGVLVLEDGSGYRVEPLGR
jgi:broad specificity phosphatase PhoE